MNRSKRRGIHSGVLRRYIVPANTFNRAGHSVHAVQHIPHPFSSHHLDSSAVDIMRIAASTLLVAPLAYAFRYDGHAQHADQIQVYLHPSPSSPHASSAVPTLTADQANAVLTHHMGEIVSDFDEIPANAGMWGHLMGMWEDEEREGRVVIVDGGVAPQSGSYS